MERNRKVRYDIITAEALTLSGMVKKMKEQLNDPIRASWRPIVMSWVAPNALVVLLEKSDA